MLFPELSDSDDNSMIDLTRPFTKNGLESDSSSLAINSEVDYEVASKMGSVYTEDEVYVFLKSF